LGAVVSDCVANVTKSGALIEGARRCTLGVKEKKWGTKNPPIKNNYLHSNVYIREVQQTVTNQFPNPKDYERKYHHPMKKFNQ